MSAKYRLQCRLQAPLERRPPETGPRCRGKRGDLVKLIWWDGQGLCLFSKRLEKGRFVWPSPADVAVHLSPAQLAMLMEGIDWRMPQRTWRPEAAG